MEGFFDWEIGRLIDWGDNKRTTTKGEKVERVGGGGEWENFRLFDWAIGLEERDVLL